MSWFVLALIAPLVWAIVNLIDDHLLKNVYRSATFGAVMSGIVGFVPATYLYVRYGLDHLAPSLIVAAIAAGASTVIFYYFYFRTLESDEPSVAIALNNIAPAIVLVLAYFLLQEKLHTLQYVGIAILLTGSVALTVLDVKKMKLSRVAWLALCGAIAYALASIFAKYAYQHASFHDVYFWISIGFGLGGGVAFLCLKDKHHLRRLLNLRQKRLAIVLIGVEVLNIAGEVIQGLAIHGGPVTIVRALEGIQPLYVLAIGIIMAQFFPRHFRERKDARFRKKLVCMSFMVLGLFML